jgi:hypothetical protein
MIGEVDDAPALRVPSPGGPQAPDPGKIGIVRNPPELHVVGSGENSVVDPFEQFANHRGAQFILNEIGGLLP